MDMNQFFTRQIAEEGVKLPLDLPDGTPTEHWIQIRGVHSDEFRRQESRGKREVISIVRIEDEVEREKATHEAQLKLIASLVISWSFPEECTEENVIAFLREAPQIASEINLCAANNALFYRKK